MFTRTVELTCKPGKNKELTAVINDKVIPLLRKQNGFVDEITLVSEHEPNRIVAISFWQNRDDAERYQRNAYPQVNEMVQSLIDTSPVVKTYNVETSTTHKLAAGKAA